MESQIENGADVVQRTIRSAHHRVAAAARRTQLNALQSRDVVSQKERGIVHTIFSGAEKNRPQERVRRWRDTHRPFRVPVQVKRYHSLRIAPEHKCRRSSSRARKRSPSNLR